MKDKDLVSKRLKIISFTATYPLAFSPNEKLTNDHQRATERRILHKRRLLFVDDMERFCNLTGNKVQ